MPELGRVAQAAFRSASLLRSSTSRWQSCSPSFISASPMHRSRCLSTSPTFQSIQGSNASPNSSLWTNPSRGSRPSPPSDDTNIRKPDISSYGSPSASSRDNTDPGSLDNINDDFNFASDLEFEIGELDKNKRIEPEAPPPRPNLRLVPRTGRTVQVTRNVDVGRAFRVLGIQIAQNKLRQEVRLQKFHERPGLKRKRLKSERWQYRFMKGFKAAATRVRQLTKQGW
ncbi:hypothetical protein F4779DRAFT_573885 [Xylariaceae sp. FL0662B]|nr:hypothetical protein F4779DRAFT_573885 [Xylariaceae sp. FL0662B]